METCLVKLGRAFTVGSGLNIANGGVSSGCYEEVRDLQVIKLMMVVIVQNFTARKLREHRTISGDSAVL